MNEYIINVRVQVIMQQSNIYMTVTQCEDMYIQPGPNDNEVLMIVSCP